MKILFTSLLMFVSTSSFAQMSSESQAALQDTQDLMKNKAQRQEAIDKNAQYKKMDQQVENLSSNNPINKEIMYSIAADVMTKLAEKTNGDPEAMKKIVEEAQKNPEKFMNDYFTVDQKNAVRGVASDIEKTQKISPTK